MYDFLTTERVFTATGKVHTSYYQNDFSVVFPRIPYQSVSCLTGENIIKHYACCSIYFNVSIYLNKMFLKLN